MLDQRHADLSAGAEQHLKRRARHVGLLHRGEHRAGDDLRRARMGAVPLDDHRTAGRQRRSGVASRRREGEREVRRAEDDHRPDRAMGQAQIGARKRLAVRQRGVMARIEIRRLFDQIGEQAKLPGRPAALAVEPRLGKAGLRHADLGDFAAARFDLVRDQAQERGALGARPP